MYCHKSSQQQHQGGRTHSCWNVFSFVFNSRCHFDFIFHEVLRSVLFSNSRCFSSYLPLLSSASTTRWSEKTLFVTWTLLDFEALLRAQISPAPKSSLCVSRALCCRGRMLGCAGSVELLSCCLQLIFWFGRLLRVLVKPGLLSWMLAFVLSSCELSLCAFWSYFRCLNSSDYIRCGGVLL